MRRFFLELWGRLPERLDTFADSLGAGHPKTNLAKQHKAHQAGCDLWRPGEKCILATSRRAAK